MPKSKNAKPLIHLQNVISRTLTKYSEIYGTVWYVNCMVQSPVPQQPSGVLYCTYGIVLYLREEGKKSSLVQYKTSISMVPTMT